MMRMATAAAGPGHPSGVALGGSVVSPTKRRVHTHITRGWDGAPRCVGTSSAGTQELFPALLPGEVGAGHVRSSGELL